MGIGDALHFSVGAGSAVLVQWSVSQCLSFLPGYRTNDLSEAWDKACADVCLEKALCRDDSVLIFAVVCGVTTLLLVLFTCFCCRRKPNIAPDLADEEHWPRAWRPEPNSEIRVVAVSRRRLSDRSVGANSL